MLAWAFLFGMTKGAIFYVRWRFDNEQEDDEEEEEDA